MRTASVIWLLMPCLVCAQSSCDSEQVPLRDLTSNAAPAADLDFQSQAKAVREGRSDTIRLDETLVTDQDLPHLEGLEKNLRRINLSHTNLSDAALNRLAECPKLEQVRIASPKFTDGGVASLTSLPRLKHLHLIGAPLTIGCVPHLKKLSGLSSLYLDDTEITLSGMRELVEALPNTHIHFDGGHHRDDARADDHAQ